jgi:hypothetical protein
VTAIPAVAKVAGPEAQIDTVGAERGDEGTVAAHFHAKARGYSPAEAFDLRLEVFAICLGLEGGDSIDQSRIKALGRMLRLVIDAAGMVRRSAFDGQTESNAEVGAGPQFQHRFARYQSAGGLVGQVQQVIVDYLQVIRYAPIGFGEVKGFRRRISAQNILGLGQSQNPRARDIQEGIARGDRKLIALRHAAHVPAIETG